ncbi:hypothetical protein APSETT444_005034 [Aspergillus pseudonomiae]
MPVLIMLKENIHRRESHIAIRTKRHRNPGLVVIRVGPVLIMSAGQWPGKKHGVQFGRVKQQSGCLDVEDGVVLHELDLAETEELCVCGGVAGAGGGCHVDGEQPDVVFQGGCAQEGEGG